jgi:FeS assembly protein IscX
MNIMIGLTWDATYELVLALEAAHPDCDLERLGYAQLTEWIVALPDFADDPGLVNDHILRDILREWYEKDSG